MKAFILFSLLSFASAIVMIPSDGNMTSLESTHLLNFTKINNSDNSDNSNVEHHRSDLRLDKHNTNYDNSRHRPHLAVVETTSRKLLFSDDSDSSADDTVEGNGRRLLRRSSKGSPPPPPPPPPPTV